MTWHYITLHYMRYVTLRYTTLQYMYAGTHIPYVNYTHTLHCVALRCIALHYITLHYMIWHDITLHYMDMHYITLRYVTLHYMYAGTHTHTIRKLHTYLLLHCVALRCSTYITLHDMTYYMHYMTWHDMTWHVYFDIEPDAINAFVISVQEPASLPSVALLCVTNREGAQCNFGSTEYHRRQTISNPSNSVDLHCFDATSKPQSWIQIGSIRGP